MVYVGGADKRFVLIEEPKEKDIYGGCHFYLKKYF